MYLNTSASSVHFSSSTVRMYLNTSASSVQPAQSTTSQKPHRTRRPTNQPRLGLQNQRALLSSVLPPAEQLVSAPRRDSFTHTATTCTWVEILSNCSQSREFKWS
jgi:hypothetical protein